MACGTASNSGARGRVFDPHSGRRVVSLRKIHLPPKSTGNTQEAVAPFRHDRKIVYWGVKQKRNETKQTCVSFTEVGEADFIAISISTA